MRCKFAFLTMNLLGTPIIRSKMRCLANSPSYTGVYRHSLVVLLLQIFQQVALHLHVKLRDMDSLRNITNAYIYFYSVVVRTQYKPVKSSPAYISISGIYKKGHNHVNYIYLKSNCVQKYLGCPILVQMSKNMRHERTIC
jgi:hypothetical protein